MRTPLALTALVIAAIADVSSGTPTHYVVNTRDASIAIRTFQFSPDTLRVKRGTPVVWSNADEIEHTITSGTPAEPDNRFGGVVDKRGATHAATLEKPGTYAYFCDRHRFMQGTVIVTR
jgi:plastocyanin